MRSKSTLVISIALALAVAGGSVFANGGGEQAAPEIPIHDAVMTGNISAIKKHIEAGTDINTKDQYGSTPLIIAATFGLNESAVALIEGGADVSIANGEGSSPLHIAAFLCHTKIVKALIDAGADRNAVNPAGRTPLDSVSGDFEDSRPIYEGIEASLAPFGFKLDYKHLEKTRPEIATLLAAG